MKTISASSDFCLRVGYAPHTHLPLTKSSHMAEPMAGEHECLSVFLELPVRLLRTGTYALRSVREVVNGHTVCQSYLDVTYNVCDVYC